MHFIIPGNIAKKIMPLGVFLYYYTDKRIDEDEKSVYDYYADVIKKPITGTKWEVYPSKFDSLFKKYNIDLSDKKILEISGGPGYLAKHLEKKCKKIVVTELTERSCKGMSDALSMEVVKYDYNIDKIDFLFRESFDVIINNLSINYCNNLDDYAKRLYNVVSRGGIVYVSFIAPTLGALLRTQFSEYSYNILYHPEILKRIFIQNGFKLVDSYTDWSYDYLWGGLKRSFRHIFIQIPFLIIYKFFALRRKKNINRQLIQKHMVCIFKKENTYDQ
jgi:2-polyprenyl-3-methyl-5-hydroxy-6-metoxy-1,4-benzoquinol methylase